MTLQLILFFNFRFIVKIANWLERKIQREAYDPRNVLNNYKKFCLSKHTHTRARAHIFKTYVL